jgi:hypothetical protein
MELTSFTTSPQSLHHFFCIVEAMFGEVVVTP